MDPTRPFQYLQQLQTLEAKTHTHMAPPPPSILLLFALWTTAAAAASHVLSTNSRWVVDGEGRRVKLACVNWAAHLEPVAAEGLGRQPLDSIARAVGSMGFNCVRLTWPLYIATNASLASLTLRRSLQSLGLHESVAAVGVNNPHLLDLSLINVFKAVVSSLAQNNIMVILDNQISKPGWCCSRLDGNGFFGDPFFDTNEWLHGLTLMAAMFNGSSNVVGMSLRNELRGPNQNLSKWYKYMQLGAEAVHAANPSVLVILSGLDYDKDLSFLADKQVQLSFTGKLVFELHWYGFSDGGDWGNENTNRVCASVVRNIKRKAGFLLKQGWPLFLSEFGVDIGGANVADNRFLSCFVSVAAELDLDWAIWALQGSYFIREGQLGFDETYGVLSWDWCKPRNPSFLQRIASLQSPFQGPGLPNLDASPYDIIFHPSTGLCVRKNPLLETVELGLCTESEAWNFTEGSNIALNGTELCLQAEGVGKPAKLAAGCGASNSQWERKSDSMMHIAATIDRDGSTVCLDLGPNGTVVTNPCTCLIEDGPCDPGTQWFKIIKSSRGTAISRNSLPHFEMLKPLMRVLNWLALCILV